uniref:Uncharacterized protein n=1 Tax=Triticum urartu TaxID=4572 RepID=A0A8R7USM0_TRIUA
RRRLDRGHRGGCRRRRLGFLAAPSRVFPASIAAVEAKQQQRRTQTPCC